MDVGEKHANLWAPWRMEYIRSLTDSEENASDCFLCDYAGQPEQDAANRVLHRSRGCLVVMNRYPYTNGHLLLAPIAHAPDLHDLDEDVLSEQAVLTRDWTRILTETVHCDGLNVGMNFGRCAGAGLPGHLHIHLVPRWNGDTNFMAVTGRTRVIPQDLDETFGLLRDQARRLGALEKT